MITSLVVLFIGVLCSYWYHKNRDLYELNITELVYFKINYPVINAIYKHFYAIIKLGLSNSEERFKILAEYCFIYGDSVKCWFGPKMLIITSKPETVQKVLMSTACLEKWNTFYGLMERDFGLITARYSTWKDHRKFFNYSFNSKILQSFIPTFVEHSQLLVERLSNNIDNEFDLLPFCKKISFDILCSTSLGTDMTDYSKNAIYDKVFQAFEITEEAMNRKFQFPFLYPQTIFKLTKLFKDERKSQKVLTEFQNDILERRRTFLKKEAVKNNENEDLLIERNILIDHIIINEDKFTEEQIKDHIVTFVSGYETWANALAHTMLLLAIHPEIQEKCFDEINNVFNSKDEKDEIDAESMNQLQYLDMVQKEVYRLMPTVPMILRQTLNDFELEKGIVIKKDLNFVINLYAMHRRKDIWGQDADKFNPDNFLLDNASKRHPFSYLPFSGGHRNCIGYRYTTGSMKITVMSLIKNYRFSSTMKLDDLRFKSYISLKLCTQHLVKIHKRQ